MFWYTYPEMINAIRDGRSEPTIEDKKRLMRHVRRHPPVA